MLFDADKGDSGIVRDASGDIIFYPVSGDTETGRVVCYKRVGDNGVGLDDKDEIVRERHVYRAPLTISPVGGFNAMRYQGTWATPIYKEVISDNECD